MLRDTRSLLLIAITAISLCFSGVVVTQLWARHVAKSVIADVVSCEVGDRVDVAISMSTTTVVAVPAPPLQGDDD